MQKLIGRPMKTKSILEELNMEITAAALEGIEQTAEVELRLLFHKIADAATYAQAVNQGLKSPRGKVNEDLLAFLQGEENLN